MKSVEAIVPLGSEGSEGSGLLLYSFSILPFCFCGSDKKRKEKGRGSTIENHFLHFLHFCDPTEGAGGDERAGGIVTAGSSD